MSIKNTNRIYGPILVSKLCGIEILLGSVYTALSKGRVFLVVDIVGYCLVSKLIIDGFRV